MLQGKRLILFVGVAVMCVAVPIFLVLLLHHTDRARESDKVMERLRSDLNAQVEIVLDDSFNVLNTYTFPTFGACDGLSSEIMRRLAYTSVYVKDLMVTDGNKNVICNTSGSQQIIRRRAPPQSLADGTHHVEAVQIESEQLEALLISRELGDDKTLSALVLSNSLVSARSHKSLLEGGFVFLSLIDGTDVGRYPQSTLSTPATRHLDDFTVLDGPLTNFPFELKIFVANDRLSEPLVDNSFWISIFGALVFGSALFTGLCYMTLTQPSSLNSVDLAIRNRQFVASYQPIADIKTGDFIGCEALIRLRKPDGTLIQPEAFIEEAEGSGLAIEMTVLLMKRIRADLEEFYSQNPSLKVCINLFSDHLNRYDTIAEIERVFGPSKIQFEQLTFELTERLPVDSSKMAKQVIAKIQALGSKVALDDVGTGHNGLKYLMELGVDIIKIDKLFIDGVSESGFSKTIVDALIKLAKEMDILVVAEGIERLDQVAKLRELGVHMAQGYFYSRPLAPDAFVAFMEDALLKQVPNSKDGGQRRQIPEYLKLVSKHHPVTS